MASMKTGRLANEDGEIVHNILCGTEKTTSNASLKHLPKKTTVSRMEENDNITRIGLGNISSLVFESEVGGERCSFNTPLEL
jgi:hypothetical protein